MKIRLPGASGFLGRNLGLGAPSNCRILALFRKYNGFSEFVARANKPHGTPVCCDVANPDQVAELFQKYGRERESCRYMSDNVDMPWSCGSRNKICL